MRSPSRSKMTALITRSHPFLVLLHGYVDGSALHAAGAGNDHDRTSVSGGKQRPVPLGDDVDGAVDHLNGGLVVDCIGRIAEARRPLFSGWKRVLRQVGVVQMRKDREIDHSQRVVAALRR